MDLSANYIVLGKGVMRQAKHDYIVAIKSELAHPNDVRCKNRRLRLEKEILSPWMEYISDEEPIDFVRAAKRRFGL